MPLTAPLLLAALTRSVARRTGRGLYAGKTVLSGNRVSEDGGNRSRRVWKPNAQPASLWSAALGRAVRVRATASALRNVDKAGGLDRYLLRSSPAELGGEVGEGLRAAVVAALAERQRAAAVGGGGGGGEK
jgi:large subunit ribosomal protein L28